MTAPRFRLLAALLLALLSAGQIHADLDAVKAEPKLERRARKAIDNADRMIDVARDIFLKEGPTEEHKAALREVRESVELAYKSLSDTGKKPRKNAKHYKRAEIKSRELVRRLESFRNEMSYMEREQIDKVILAVREIQGKLLKDVMGGGD